MGTRNRALIVGALAVLAWAAAFGPASPQALAAPEPETLRTCDGAPFSMPVFDRPANYETKNTGLAKALRAAIRIKWLDYPKKNWWLLYKGKREAQVASGSLDEVEGLEAISFERKNGKWEWSGSGGCLLEAYRPGQMVGVWDRTRGQDYSRSTTSFKVDVYEQSCSGGAPPTGRVARPTVEYFDDSIVVTYFIKPNRPGNYTCPSAPPVTKTLELKEPIGDREVLDGSMYPYPQRMAPPGPKGFFDRAIWFWLSPTCFRRERSICVTQAGPSRVKAGETATYKVRVRARHLLTGVRMRASGGASGELNRFVGTIGKRRSRLLTFRATCPEGNGEATPLSAFPTVTFTTHRGGEVRTFATRTRPHITCVPR
jgi:hypothetical protein